MPEFDRSARMPDGQPIEGEIVSGDPAACLDLVAINPIRRQPPKTALAPPSATFLTHLIATAERAPQTRSLRRASPADARSAYGAGQNRHAAIPYRTRQII